MKTHRSPGQPGQSITRHVYGTGAAVLAEYSVNPSTNEETALRWFVHGEGFPEPLAMVDLSAAGDNSTPGVEEFLYYLTDVQGSVGALSNAVGQVVERYFYTPYGQTTVTAADGTTPRTESLYGNPFAYTGQRYEPQTGLYHFWARVYSPTLGRFLQEDAQGVIATAGIALGYQGGAPGVTPPVTGPADEYPNLLNLYAYAMGNPLRFTDPLGLMFGGLLDTLSSASLSAYVRASTLTAAHPVATQIVGGILAAANLYSMITDPEYLDIILAQPNAMGLLQADLEMLLKAGAAVKLACGAPGLAFKLGSEGEAWLAKMYPGRSQVGLKTSRGMRYVDQLSGSTALESKVGFKRWSSDLWEQILKDEEILENGFEGIASYEWHFFRSLTTGEVGADPRVFAELGRAGIRAVVHN